MRTYAETAKLNEEKLKALFPDWQKYYKIKMKVVDPANKVIVLSKGRRSFKYWLGTGSYYNNQRFIYGKIKVEMLYTLLYG